MRHRVLSHSLVIGIATLFMASSCRPSTNQGSNANAHTIIPVNSAQTVPVTVYGPQYQSGSAKKTAHSVNGRLLIEGDILVAPVEYDSARGPAAPGLAVSNTYQLWPDRTIPYEITSNHPGSSTIRSAIAVWQQKTSIRFIPRTNETSYVVFKSVEGNVSWSYVGRTRGAQEIALGETNVGVVVHEIGHAVGLLHEQSRSDRDKYITINWDNISPDYRDQFEMDSYSTLMGNYDLSSVMHYTSWTFSTNGQPVMTTKAGDTIGWHDTLSEGDVAAVEALYAAESKPDGNADADLAQRILTAAQPTPTRCVYQLAGATKPDARSVFTMTVSVNGTGFSPRNAVVELNHQLPESSLVKITRIVLSRAPFDKCLASS